MSAEEIEALKEYSAEDVSDAVLALESVPPGQIPRGGFLADIVPVQHFTPSFSASHHTDPSPASKTTVGPAFTFLFRSKDVSAPAGVVSPPKDAVASSTGHGSISWPDPQSKSPSQESNIPPGTVWSDLAPAQSTPAPVVVISQPQNQTCAVMGAVHARRLAYLGVESIIVSGRVRDLRDLADLNLTRRLHLPQQPAKQLDSHRNRPLPVFTGGISAVSASAEAVAHAVQVPVEVVGVVVAPGDLIVARGEPAAVVRVPKELVSDVLRWLRERGESEERVEEAVRGGEAVGEAFKTHRKKMGGFKRSTRS